MSLVVSSLSPMLRSSPNSSKLTPSSASFSSKRQHAFSLLFRTALMCSKLMCWPLYTNNCFPFATCTQWHRWVPPPLYAYAVLRCMIRRTPSNKWLSVPSVKEPLSKRAFLRVRSSSAPSIIYAASLKPHLLHENALGIRLHFLSPLLQIDQPEDVLQLRASRRDELHLGERALGAHTVPDQELYSWMREMLGLPVIGDQYGQLPAKSMHRGCHRQRIGHLLPRLLCKLVCLHPHLFRQPQLERSAVEVLVRVHAGYDECEQAVPQICILGNRGRFLMQSEWRVGNLTVGNVRSPLQTHASRPPPCATVYDSQDQVLLLG